MPTEKELKRVLDIARTHARNALAKDATQRESYLGFCRAHWKRYAQGFSKSEQECERFADEMDRATRALIALRNEFAALLSILPEGPAETDLGPVEGAMESVIVHEAALESPDAVPERDPDKTEIAAAEADEPAELDAKTLEEQRFEEMDRANARFGFTFPRPAKAEPEAEKPEGDPELQRRVRSVLRTHQQTAGDATDDQGDRKSKRKA